MALAQHDGDNNKNHKANTEYWVQAMSSTVQSSSTYIILILTMRCEGDFYISHLAEASESLRNLPKEHI